MAQVLLINPTKKPRKKRATKKKTASKRKRVQRRKPPTKRAAPKRRKKPATRRAAPTRGVKTMAKRKKRTYRRKPAARRNPTPRRRTYRARRNPSRARRTYARAKSTFMGLNIPSALKNQFYLLGGMFAAKWMAKRFDPAASETDPGSWNWSSYLKAGLGAIVAGALAQNIKRGSGQKVLEGGLAYVGFKLIQNELIADSTWWSEQFGQNDYVPTEYLGAGYQPGDVEYNEAGQPYLLGQDGQWQELPTGYSGEGDIVPVGRLGAEYPAPLDPVGPLGDEYAEALLGEN